MSTARILIVDDNPVNLKLAESVLEAAGYDVLKASDAIEALDVIRATPPEAILMDIALPGMDGLALTRQIKANPATCHIPVIALTASAMKGDDEKVWAAGCSGYITKPINTRTLVSQLEELME